jgi:PiT family inorganic phosphate transporter
LLLLAPGFDLHWIIIAVATAMLLGSLFNARRVAETMSHKITTLTHNQGLSANLVTALLVIFASKLGMSISTTPVSVGSLFGIGLESGKANGDVIASISLSWLLTLPCAAISAAAVYYAAIGASQSPHTERYVPMSGMRQTRLTLNDGEIP